MSMSLNLNLAKTFGVLRTGVGALSWVSPRASWQTFGLGAIEGDPRAGVITRLFGVRELALGQALLCPDPTVRKAALQTSVVVDSVDVVASLIALRNGAPKAIAITFVAGAGFFVALGLAGLAQERSAARLS
jgi:hypothetical protein